MKTPDLWLLVKSLEGKDRIRVRKFLASPYFNSDEKHIELFEAVAEQIKENRCERKALDAILFPNDAFSYTRITNLISDLKRLMESFFVQEELKKKPFYGEYLLMQAMKEKDLPKFFGQSEERIHKHLNEQTFKKEETFLQNFLTQEQAYQFSLVTEGAKNAELIGEKIKSLHLFYVMAMLRSVCEDLNQLANREIQGKTPHRFFIQYILANQILYSKEALLRLYILVLRMLVEPAEIDHFETFVEDFLNIGEKISKKEKWELLQYAQAYSQRASEANSIEIENLLFRLYSSTIGSSTDNWAISEGFVSPVDGLRFLYLAVGLQKTEEIEIFISNYSSHADTGEKQKALAFYQAYFMYKLKNKRKEALEILHSHNFQNTAFAKEIPLLLTQIYYDSYENEALHRLWEGFCLDIRKDKDFSAKDREIYENLRKNIQKLLKLRMQSKISRPAVFEKNRMKLQEEIRSSSKLPLSPWLLGELAVL